MIFPNCRRGLILAMLAGWLVISPGAGAQDSPEADALSSQAARHYSAGNWGEALAAARRALILLEARFPPDHPKIAESLFNLALYTRAQGGLAEAEALLAKGYKISTNLDKPDPGLTASFLSSMGSLYQIQGRLSEAEARYKESLTLREKLSPPDHSNIARSLNNLGYLYQLQGRANEAEILHKRALSIWEQTLPANDPLRAWSPTNLGILYLEQGRYDDADPLLRRALEINTKALPATHPDVAKSWSLVGSVSEKRGRLEEAESNYLKAISILKAVLPAEHPDLATALNNLAVVHDRQGRLGEAEKLYDQSLDMRRKALPPGHPDISAVQNNLSILYRRQGRLDKAETFAREALAGAEAALPPGHPAIARAVGTLAVVSMARRDWPSAYAQLDRMSQMFIAIARRDSASLESTAGRSSDAASLDLSRGPFLALVKVANRIAETDVTRRAELTSMTFAYAQWAARPAAAAALAQMAARSSPSVAGLAALVRERQDLINEWRLKDKDMLSSVLLNRDGRNSAAAQASRSRMEAIDRRIAELDAALGRDFAKYLALARTEPASIEDVRQSLRDDEALVFSASTNHTSEQLPEDTHIWVVTKTAARWVRSNLGTQALTREVLALRCGLDASAWIGSNCGALTGMHFTETDRAAGKPLPFDHARAHKLYLALFGDVRELIQGKHLLVVPSGPLTILPFQVLVTEPPKSGDHKAVRWLARDHALTVLPAVASLKALRRDAKPSRAERAYIGFANPLLDGAQAHVEFGAYFRQQAALARSHVGCAAAQPLRTTSLRGSIAPVETRGHLANVAHLKMQSPLPETADEVCAVARDVAGDFNQVHIGARATEHAIKRLSNASGPERLANARILHFATHGALAGELSGASEPGLILTPPQTPDDTDDGYLSASEIAGLKLDADWVILSACNTAGAASPASGGREAKGAVGAEALSGLARAFFYSGARALLVSHWAVDSDATVALINSAVGAIAKDTGVGRAEALRRAMLTMIDAGKPQQAHPAYWAPFVVVGEGAAMR